MSHWIAFDEDTSSSLRSRLPGEPVIQLPARSALNHALRLGKTLVAVMPAPGLGRAALAVFRWNQIAASVPTLPDKSISTATASDVPAGNRARAAGFLGLTDEPVFEEGEPQDKKSWWKRFWEE